MDSNLEFDIISASFWLLLSTFMALTSCSARTLAADTCSFQQGTTSVVAYCEDGCCDNNCCSSSSSSNDTVLILIILAAIVAVVIIVLVVVAVICCLKEKKKDRIKDMHAMELNQRSYGSGSPDDAERPRMHRENAFMANGDARTHLRTPVNKEVVFVNSEINSHQTKRNSGRSRNCKIKPSDPALPQVQEVDEPEDE